MSDNKHKMHVKTWSKPRLKNFRKQSNKVMKKKNPRTQTVDQNRRIMFKDVLIYYKST